MNPTTPDLATQPRPLPEGFRELEGILGRLQSGDDGALNELYDYSHAHLRRVASRILGEQDRTPTLNATALVHESFLKLASGEQLRRLRDVRHFLNLAAVCMRQAMLTHLRRETAVSRGRDYRRNHGVEQLLDPFTQSQHRFEDLCEALDTLESESERTAELLKLRFFHRMSPAEIGELVDLSEGHVARIIATGKARLRILLS